MSEDNKISSSLFNSILDAIPHDIIIEDEKGKVIEVNIKAKMNLFKSYNRSSSTNNFESILDTFVEGSQVEPRDDFRDLVNRSNQSIYSTEKLKISLNRNQNKRYYEVITNPIFDSQRGFLGRIWLFKDITEHELLSQEKSDFLSIASHQLRTPLTSIIGYTDMILAGDFGQFGDNLKEPLEAVFKSGKDMSQLINDLLNLSRIEKSDNTVNLSDIDLNQILDEIIDSLKEKLNEKNMQIELNINSQISMNSDKIRLHESLVNLIENAIKYGKTDTAVQINAMVLNGDRVSISIKNYGLGIPTDQQDKIFSKFFRASNVMTEAFQGSGIGLYYVKKCMDDLEGDITFESIPNKTTTFTISLPKN